jgi:hypothetical protein
VLGLLADMDGKADATNSPGADWRGLSCYPSPCPRTRSNTCSSPAMQAWQNERDVAQCMSVAGARARWNRLIAMLGYPLISAFGLSAKGGTSW